MAFAVIVDVETTGLDPATGSLVEVACGRFDLEIGKLVDARSFLVARARGEHGAEDVHGISAALVDVYGMPTSTVDGLARYSAGARCMIAHNASFDRQWVPEQPAPWADSMDFEWPRPSSGRSLIAVALAHGVGVVAAHRALDDVLTLARLLERARELGADLEQLTTRALRPKVLVAAQVPRSRNDEVRAAGFRWHPAPIEQWRRTMFADDVSKLGFPTIEIKPEQRTA